jgi:hypothetical protein
LKENDEKLTKEKCKKVLKLLCECGIIRKTVNRTENEGEIAWQ